MTYLWIFFVIAVALAPLSHFVPSKRQRKVARMREYAAVHGLFVEFRHLPGSDPARTDSAMGRRGAQNIIYYGKRLPPSREKQSMRAAWLCAQQQWRGVDRRTPVPAQFSLLPAEILGASVDDSSCGIYWSEVGEEAGVEQILQVLEAWSAELRP